MPKQKPKHNARDAEFPSLSEGLAGKGGVDEEEFAVVSKQRRKGKGKGVSLAEFNKHDFKKNANYGQLFN